MTWNDQTFKRVYLSSISTPYCCCLAISHDKLSNTNNIISQNITAAKFRTVGETIERVFATKILWIAWKFYASHHGK